MLYTIAAKKASMNQKFPFTVHRRVVAFIFSEKLRSHAPEEGSFEAPVGDSAVCHVHFTAECFTQAFYVKGAKQYLKPGSVLTTRKKTSASTSEGGGGVSVYSLRRLYQHHLSLTCTVSYAFPHKGNSGEARARKLSKPGQPGSYEEDLSPVDGAGSPIICSCLVARSQNYLRTWSHPLSQSVSSISMLYIP